ncbi:MULTISPECIES: cold-shock protein [unclassified Streptomyces]|uniref:cold-shock protein n=1 Tax=unclassified Streptomyces TaxID=2593676 RepID=UPI000DC79DBD|nr:MULTISPECIES: cold-shock protein [unclassified Streptomyces]AWZ05319.1 cold-shock protein [Streptomyces sp. ICC4]AWZ11433.1 cold-shock protein [Streptomyces sp. ICC1]
MQRGRVKWFNTTKGFGFIKPEGSDQDIFVHMSAVSAAGLNTLDDDQEVLFEIEENQKNGKASAINLKVVV